MKPSNMKRKRISFSQKKDSQLRITKYLERASSTPIENHQQVSKEKLRNKLIQNNLRQFISNDIENDLDKEMRHVANSSSENELLESNEKQCIEDTRKCHTDLDVQENTSEKNIGTQNPVGVIDNQSAEYWRNMSIFWESKAKKYKQQADFSNKLLIRKLRDIESLKEMLKPNVDPEEEPKSETKLESKKVLLFEMFQKYFSTDLLFVLRSVRPGSTNDRKFLKYGLKGIYQGHSEVFMNRTLSGRTKQPITPEKLNVLKEMFKERIRSEGDNIDTNLTRYNSLFRHIPNTLNELAKEHNKKVQKTVERTEQNLGITDNLTCITPNSQLSVPTGIEYSNTGIPTQNMIILMPSI